MNFWNCHECGAANDLGMKICGHCHATKAGPLYRFWLRHPVLTFGVPLASLIAALVWALNAMRKAWPLPVLALLLTGCNSALVSVERHYHFNGPVNYPTVTVERSNNAQGAGVQR